MSHNRVSCCSAILLFVFQLGYAQLRFEESAVERGLNHFYDESLWMGGGAASFDFDSDGDQDIYVVGGEAPDALFLNNGNGYFENISTQVGLAQLTDSVMTTSVVTGDIDNDGRNEIEIYSFPDDAMNCNGLPENNLVVLQKTGEKTEH